MPSGGDKIVFNKPLDIVGPKSNQPAETHEWDEARSAPIPEPFTCCLAVAAIGVELEQIDLS